MFELVYPAEPAVLLPLPTATCRGGQELSAAEMVPVVEENGLVIGRAARSSVHGTNRFLHPVVHLHIVNRFGDVFLQKRSMMKDLFPGKWDTAVGGHVNYGESLEEALFRESFEELALREYNPVYLKTYVWESKRERELVNVFATVGNFRLAPCNEEVSEGRYWTVGEIAASSGQTVFTPNFEKEFQSIKDKLSALL